MLQVMLRSLGWCGPAQRRQAAEEENKFNETENAIHTGAVDIQSDVQQEDEFKEIRKRTSSGKQVLVAGRHLRAQNEQTVTLVYSWKGLLVNWYMDVYIDLVM